MKFFLATRPAFLTITALAVFLGISFAWHSGANPSLITSTLTLAGALLAHAGANVFNDVHDAKNGSDACNTERIAPFTGGSRFIQNGTLTIQSMARLSWALFLAATLAGLALIAISDQRLLFFGMIGLMLAIAYSAPPFALMSRGMGEIAVGVAWALIVAGSDFAARQVTNTNVLWVALPFGFQTMLILLANQLPDFAADQAVGKSNLAVRWGRRRAAMLYQWIVASSYITITSAIVLKELPASALSCFLALPVSLVAARDIAKYCTDPPKLRRSIILTLISAHLFGITLILSLIAGH